MYNSVLIDHTKCSAKVEKLIIEGVIFLLAEVLCTDYCSEQSRKLSSQSGLLCFMAYFILFCMCLLPTQCWFNVAYATSLLSQQTHMIFWDMALYTKPSSLLLSRWTPFLSTGSSRRALSILNEIISGFFLSFFCRDPCFDMSNKSTYSPCNDIEEIWRGG